MYYSLIPYRKVLKKMKVGEKIKAARLRKGYTQEELGNLIGVQKSAVAKYESGRVVNIKRSTLKKLSEVLEIPPVELVDGVPEQVQKNNDIMADIIVRMRTDEVFFEVVQTLNSLEKEQLAGVMQMLNAFTK